jgi:putative DNA methylase
MDELARDKVIEKKAGMVRLLPPAERIRRGDNDLPGVRADATSFHYAIDAVHTVLYIARIDGMPQAKAFMDRLGLADDQAFLATVQGLVNAIPRVKVKGEWVVPEAGLLDTLAVLYLPDITLPAEPAQIVVTEQGALFGE